MSLRNFDKESTPTDLTDDSHMISVQKVLDFGWIDLNKSKGRLMIIFLLVFGCVSVWALDSGLSPKIRSAAKVKRNNLWLNPFETAKPMENRPLQLSAEYIYADQRLIAVEDAGAGSVSSADLAGFRSKNGRWNIIRSSDISTRVEQRNRTGDFPVPALGLAQNTRPRIILRK